MVAYLEQKNKDWKASNFAFWDTYFLDVWDYSGKQTSVAPISSSTVSSESLAHAHMLRRQWRTRRYDGATMKSIFRPSLAETVYMHMPFTCFEDDGGGGEGSRRKRKKRRFKRAEDKRCNIVKVNYRGCCCYCNW